MTTAGHNFSESRGLILDALAGRETPRPPTGPLAVHYCAAQAGISLREYTMSSRLMAECVLRYYEKFHPDAIWISADTWVSAEAAGASVAFTGDDQPLAGTGVPLVQTPADVDRIPDPDPTSRGRCPVMLDALARVASGLGKRAVVVACFDQYPFSLACALMGFENLILKLSEDRPMIDALLERCCQYSTAYALALARAGADLLSGGDSPAGLIGPKLYRDCALPWERTVIDGLRKEVAIPISLHICGKATALLPDMATAGADVLELDHFVDMAAAANLVGPRITLWGNIDPVGILARGSVADVRQATNQLLASMAAVGHRRFVLSSGCTLAVETPAENMQAFFNAACGK